ncbi:TcaA 3rd/4th domain-containing protein [Clostridium estertheticum]|uniref:TcaA 3rd/4th domain-containing protein n=1 Tax=Clostridium estertheticum TaxID=238834 RepID=UPI001C6EA1CB|nr:hypothetical protein [Clostridium estertheticum]MBW9154422.1 hypothetical protein [Clostridium estertheticum]WLC83524.1 hypothetical protein KTC97_15800 [Clostridium estertheticum]
MKLRKNRPPYLVNTMESSDGIVKLSVFEDMNNLNITSDYPDAEIFVNGKDTKVKVNNAVASYQFTNRK